MTSRLSDRAEIERIARSYPPEARYTPAEERERYFTDAQRAAWALRFERAEVRP